MIFGDLLDLVNKKRRQKERVRTVLKFTAGICIAAAAGLAKGILTAPKSGKETREELKKKAVETMEAIKETVHKKAESVIDSAAHAAHEVSEVLSLEHSPEKKKAKAVPQET